MTWRRLILLDGALLGLAILASRAALLLHKASGDVQGSEVQRRPKSGVHGREVQSPEGRRTGTLRGCHGDGWSSWMGPCSASRSSRAGPRSFSMRRVLKSKVLKSIVARSPEP